MMVKKLIPKSIRGKITAITAAVTFLITIATVSVCFFVFQSFLMKNQIQSAEFSLQTVANNIHSDMEETIYFTKWCCSNREVVNYLNAFDGRDRLPSAREDDQDLRPLALSTYRRVRDEYYTTRPYKFLSRVIISTSNRRNFLQLYFSGDSQGGFPATVAYEAPFFQELYQAPDFEWIGFTEDPFSAVHKDIILPIVRPVYNEFNTRIVGWIYISVSSRVITDYLSAYPLPADSSLYLTVGEKTYAIRGKELKETSGGFTKKKALPGFTLSPDTWAGEILDKAGETRTLVEHSLGIEGWSIAQVLSVQQFNAQKNIYYLLIAGICLLILSLGFLTAFLLNRVIGGPVEMLRSRISAVSRGDFSQDPGIEWDHELGEVGRGINELSKNIVMLLDKRVADEKQRKDLEYQILQSQINPHFLYNTLNSIKWMATIQNASGIAEMTTALARLLKNVSKGSSATITLREELDLVRDYFLIQQYRYGGSISIGYEIASEDLYDCRIHRFSLQPIIENALFHGIEPKGVAGRIEVAARVSEENGGNDLLITVTDNGVGMSEETIRTVLEGAPANGNDFFKQVGISNVNQRIRHDFGPEYGISIDSRVGVYTAMTIRIPYIKTMNGEDSDDETTDRG